MEFYLVLADGTVPSDMRSITVPDYMSPWDAPTAFGFTAVAVNDDVITVERDDYSTHLLVVSAAAARVLGTQVLTCKCSLTDAPAHDSGDMIIAFR